MYASLCSLWLRVYYMMKCCRDLHRIMWCKYTVIHTEMQIYSWLEQSCVWSWQTEWTVSDICRGSLSQEGEVPATDCQPSHTSGVTSPAPPPPTPPSLDNYLHHTPHFSSPLNFFNVVFFDVCLLYKRKLQTIVLLSKLLVNTEKSSSE